ncbi:MAG: hypothetical protein M3Y28_03625 [Armatimonadota bacterium]|nr:hypothetical protein [Armatimonadota bacterium]
MFHFDEGDGVALKGNNAVLDMKAGDRGVVWAQYDDGQMRCYEVTFTGHDGEPFDALMREDELLPVDAQDAHSGERARVMTV